MAFPRNPTHEAATRIAGSSINYEVHPGNPRTMYDEGLVIIEARAVNNSHAQSDWVSGDNLRNESDRFNGSVSKAITWYKTNEIVPPGVVLFSDRTRGWYKMKKSINDTGVTVVNAKAAFQPISFLTNDETDFPFDATLICQGQVTDVIEVMRERGIIIGNQYLFTVVYSRSDKQWKSNSKSSPTEFGAINWTIRKVKQPVGPQGMLPTVLSDVIVVPGQHFHIPRPVQDENGPGAASAFGPGDASAVGSDSVSDEPESFGPGSSFKEQFGKKRVNRKRTSKKRVNKKHTSCKKYTSCKKHKRSTKK